MWEVDWGRHGKGTCKSGENDDVHVWMVTLLLSFVGVAIVVLCMNLYCRPCSTYSVGGKRVGADMRMMMLLNSAHAVLMPYIYLGNGMGWGWYGLAGSGPFSTYH